MALVSWTRICNIVGVRRYLLQVQRVTSSSGAESLWYNALLYKPFTLVDTFFANGFLTTSFFANRFFINSPFINNLFFINNFFLCLLSSSLSWIVFVRHCSVYCQSRHLNIASSKRRRTVRLCKVAAVGWEFNKVCYTSRIKLIFVRFSDLEEFLGDIYLNQEHCTRETDN